LMPKRYLVDEGEFLRMVKQVLENGMRVSVMGRNEDGSFIVSVYRPPPAPPVRRWSVAKQERTKEEKERGVPPSKQEGEVAPESAKESAKESAPKRAHAQTPEKGAPEGEREGAKPKGWVAYAKESLKAERRSS